MLQIELEKQFGRFLCEIRVNVAPSQAAIGLATFA